VLKQYLLLIRLPNLFTAPANVLSGYFAVSFALNTTISIGHHVDPLAPSHILQLCLLILSSILLYISGIVMNDYFDIKTDLKERPERPLPSGMVSTRRALLIALACMVSGNLAAFCASTISLLVSVLLSTVIFAYNFKLKNATSYLVGPITMGVARAVNAVLGASPFFFVLASPADTRGISSNFATDPLLRLAFVSLSLFIYVIAISLLSKREVTAFTTSPLGRSEEQEEEKEIGGREGEGGEEEKYKGVLQNRNKKSQENRNLSVIEKANTGQTIKTSFLIVFLLIAIVVVATFLGVFKEQLLIGLFLLSAIMIWTFRQVAIRNNSSAIQTAIKRMVISIIVLDSAFIAGFTGSYLGYLTLLLLIPSTLIAKKLYVT
jgi:4-hydroxybenzoate polyprenyltransferase